jgi:Fe-S-cluster containining protein
MASNLTCDGCGVCCRSMGHPPFLLDLKGGVLYPVGGDDSVADYQRLRAAPGEAQTAYLAHYERVDVPCSWLDQANQRCRFYDFRPDICRTFEVGGKWCSEHRKLHQIG